MTQRKIKRERRSEVVIVSLTPGHRMQVERVAQRERVSLAEIGRRALDQFLEREGTSSGGKGEG